MVNVVLEEVTNSRIDGNSANRINRQFKPQP